MAIDSRDKRASCFGIGVGLLPLPDSTISAADRLQSAGLYSGISASAGNLLSIGEIVLKLRTPPSAILPRDIDDLRIAVESIIRLIHFDLSSGAIRYTVTDTVPDASSVEEGMQIIYDDESATRRMYYKVNGVMRYVDLT